MALTARYLLSRVQSHKAEEPLSLTKKRLLGGDDRSNLARLPKDRYLSLSICCWDCV